MATLKHCIICSLLIASLLLPPITNSFPTSSSNSFNNLGKIRDLVLEQASQLRLKLNTDTDQRSTTVADRNVLVDFQNCVKGNKKRLDINDLLVNYLFWVEGFKLQ